MTQTAAKVGFSGKFGIEGVTAGVYVDLAEVKAITPPSLSRDFEEATHLQSPDGFKEYVGGLFDSGPASLTLNYTPANTTVLFDAFAAGVKNFQITLAGGATLRWTGAISELSLPESAPGGLLESTATVTRTTGKVEFAANVGGGAGGGE